MSDTAELNEDMSSEEIAAYADSVANEVRQERQGERKSDAEIVAGNSAPIETTAVHDTGSDSVEADGLGDDSATADGQREESGDASTEAEWLTDDVKAEAAAYGIDESELSDFDSRDELDKAIRLFEKSALDAGRKAMAEKKEDGPVRNEKGQFSKADEGEPEDGKEQSKPETGYQVSLDEELYDEEIIGEFNRMRDHYETRLQTLESHFAEAAAQAEEQRFDRSVDSLGHTELFGKTGEETPKELERRGDLMVAVKAQMIGLEQLGRPTEMSDQLIRRVANMVFADELSKKQLKKRTQKITKQSNGRLGGSSTKPLPPRDDPREEADRLYKELERA